MQPSTWSVSLKCSGLEEGEVVVTINVSISGLDTNYPENITNLTFKRKNKQTLEKQVRVL